MAHDLVDNGMDMYVGNGNHVIQGIEIYKGRPIFYNLGDLSVHRTGGTPASLTALIASTSYQNGILQEVRVYPVDLGADPLTRPASTFGIPMTPSSDMASRILADLQRDSEPFGTRMVVENGVGIIRVPREATVPIGQNIHDFGTFPTGAGGGGRGRGGRGGGRGGPRSFQPVRARHVDDALSATGVIVSETRTIARGLPRAAQSSRQPRPWASRRNSPLNRPRRGLRLKHRHGAPDARPHEGAG